MTRNTLTLLTLTLLLTGTLLVGCGNAKNEETESETDGASAPVVLTETYLTERNENDNVDSPAIWHGPEGQHWLIATAKSTDKLLVYNAIDGSYIREVGGTGTEAGQLARPNGIYIMDNLCVIVERDNHRVQVFTLPGFETVGMFGAGDLIKPYGIAMTKSGSAPQYTVWITDNYETADEQVPPDAELGKRVHRYDFVIQNGELVVMPSSTFGQTEGPGVLKVVESIAVDPPNLLIADEFAEQNNIKVYTHDGQFTGTIINHGMFKSQPEGIALYTTSGTGGYWIVTDQSKTENVFHVLDRNTFKHLGAFKGATTLNTDGIWVTNVPFGPFASGAFFAIHDDGNVACFDWAEISAALHLE